MIFLEDKHFGNLDLLEESFQVHLEGSMAVASFRLVGSSKEEKL